MTTSATKPTNSYGGFMTTPSDADKQYDAIRREKLLQEEQERNKQVAIPQQQIAVPTNLAEIMQGVANTASEIQKRQDFLQNATANKHRQELNQLVMVSRDLATLFQAQLPDMANYSNNLEVNQKTKAQQSLALQLDALVLKYQLDISAATNNVQNQQQKDREKNAAITSQNTLYLGMFALVIYALIRLLQTWGYFLPSEDELEETAKLTNSDTNNLAEEQKRLMLVFKRTQLEELLKKLQLHPEGFKFFMQLVANPKPLRAELESLFSQHAAMSAMAPVPNPRPLVDSDN